MRFEVVQRFTSSPGQVEQAYAGTELYPTLVGLPKLGGIEVLDRRDTDTTVDLRVRFRFTGDLPSAVTAVVDPERLTWVQETRHELGSGRTTFVLVPDHYPDRLQARGAFAITSDGAGAKRTVRGELKVRAPLVASRVERAIISGLEEYLVAEAPAVDAFIGA